MVRRLQLCSAAVNLASEPIRLLWTGGWDSTFRLLDAVLVHGLTIQPYYVLDTARRSSIIELNTMDRIRRSIAELSAERAALVEPSAIIAIHDIRPDPEMTARYRRLKAKTFLGEQYDWLSRFVKQFNLHGLELCVHVDDKAHAFLRGHVERRQGPVGQDAWVLREDAAHGDLALFAPFRFPVLTLTKSDMQRMAVERGFLHIMEQTWFCFTPIRNRPCGVCNPCQYAIAEGMGHRMPRAARIRHFFLPVSRPFRRVYDKVLRLRAAAS